MAVFGVLSIDYCQDSPIPVWLSVQGNYTYRSKRIFTFLLKT